MVAKTASKTNIRIDWKLKLPMELKPKRKSIGNPTAFIKVEMYANALSRKGLTEYIVNKTKNAVATAKRNEE